MAVLPSLGAIYVVTAVPRPPDLSHSSESEFHTADLGQLLRSAAFLRLNFGIFALHVMTTALFVAGPRLLSLHVSPGKHGLVYLTLIPMGMVALRIASRRNDRSGRPREAILLAGLFVILGNLLLYTGPQRLYFFLGAVMFAVMAVALAEPAMPTLLSRIAPPESRGTAGGLFHSFEFMGSFAGGALGGWFLERPSTLGGILLAIAIGWTLLAWGLPKLGPARANGTSRVET
jgi:predicted MFS family arabinose efflux permease